MLSLLLSITCSCECYRCYCLLPEAVHAIVYYLHLCSVYAIVAIVYCPLRCVCDCAHNGRSLASSQTNILDDETSKTVSFSSGNNEAAREDVSLVGTRTSLACWAQQYGESTTWFMEHSLENFISA